MGLEIIDPSGSPVSAAEMLTHLRMEPIDPDTAGETELELLAYLARLLDTATDHIQRQTGQLLAEARLRLTLDAFPHDRTVTLPMPPLQTVQAIGYTDPSGQQRTLDPATYTVDTTRKPGRIVLRPGRSWPATDGSANAVSIDFTAGYEDPPEGLTLAVKLLAAHWFENREAATDRRIDSIPHGLEQILAPHVFLEAVE